MNCSEHLTVNLILSEREKHEGLQGQTVHRSEESRFLVDQTIQRISQTNTKTERQIKHYNGDLVCNKTQQQFIIHKKTNF